MKKIVGNALEVEEEKILYVCLVVIWLKGKKEILQLPKDLQAPMQTYIEENPKNWRRLLVGGLINVAVEPYRKGYEPRMTVAYIKKAFISEIPRRQRTRGQFLTKENWNQKGIRHFFQTLRFLQHDFKRSTKIHMFFDYLHWKWYLRRGKI